MKNADLVRYNAALTRRQLDALRALGARTRVPVARYMREAVDLVIARYAKSEAQAAPTARASGSTTTPTAKRRTT